MRILDRVGRERCIALILFIVALLPRLLTLSAFITWDEFVWTYRSIKFLTALREGHWAGTFLTGHPGVVTMWAGLVGIAIKLSLGLGSWTDFVWIGQVPQYYEDDLGFLERSTPFLFASKLSVVLLTSAAVAGIYLLLKRLFNERVALFSSLLIAFNPFYLAHSRVLHLDALVASFMTLSLLSLLVYLKNRRSYLYLAISGTMAGLAFLNKSPALLLVPFTTMLLGIVGLAQRGIRNGTRLFPAFLVWAIAAGGTFFALWPAMWVDPTGTLQRMVYTATHYAAKPGETFFRGAIVSDPGAWFYPLVILFRTTPLTLLGLAASVVVLLKGTKGRKRQAYMLLVLMVFGFLFSVAMAIGDKKFDRYLLPIFPLLDIVAAVGLIELGGRISQRLGTPSKLQVPGFKGHQLGILDLGVGISFVLLLLQACHIFSYHPYYLAYYNPLLGGLQQASRVLRVGWGEGMDRAARYLNGKDDAAQLRVATPSVTLLAPFFEGQTIPLKRDKLIDADYVVLYVDDVQLGKPLIITTFREGLEPEHVVRLHGIDYVWIYPNINYVRPMELIEAQAQSGDQILLDSPNLFSRHYNGSLPLHILDVDEAEMVKHLKELSREGERVWYVTYPRVAGRPGVLLSHQLATHAYSLEERSFPDVAVYLYLLCEPSFQVASIDSPLEVNFEAKLQLKGYGLSRGTIERGRDLGVALEWEALQDIGPNYTAFLHFVDESGHLWGQGDKRILDESLLPTSLWAAGDVVLDRYRVSILAGTPLGTYWLKAGVYQREAGKRLEIWDEGGASLGTEYTLAEVRVVPSLLEPVDLDHRPGPLESRQSGGGPVYLGEDEGRFGWP